MSQNSIGINLIGYASANLGLGHTLREFARALINADHPVAILDVDAGLERSSFDLSLRSHFVSRWSDLPHNVNVWMIGLPSLRDVAAQIVSDEQLQSRLNAAFVWWELPDVPPRWHESAAAFDVLIAGSEFVKEVLANTVSAVPTILAKHPLSVSESVLPDRQRFGLPDEGLVVFTGFESNSDPERKNPFAAIRAFQLAFHEKSNVRLVIKVNNPRTSGHVHAQLKRIYALVDADDRLSLVTDRLAYPDLMSLYASCDVFVSLHRSEGLGLIPLEAMRLAKPVVATGWSGNMSYMRHGNAGLVRYKVVATTDSSVNYGPSSLGIHSRWAEPDINHAAAWLRAFADDPALRTQYGASAAVASKRYDLEARQLDFVHELDFLLRHRRMLPPKDYQVIGQRVIAEDRESAATRATLRRLVVQPLSILRRLIR